MIQLTYYDDGKGNFQSHEVSVETPHCVWNDDLNDLIEYELTNIIGYGETEEEALNNFVNKLNYALDEWNAFAKMLNEQI